MQNYKQLKTDLILMKVYRKQKNKQTNKLRKSILQSQSLTKDIRAKENSKKIENLNQRGQINKKLTEKKRGVTFTKSKHIASSYHHKMSRVTMPSKNKDKASKGKNAS